MTIHEALKRLALGASLPLLTLLVPAGFATTVACGDSDGCKQTRTTVYNELVAWEACDPTKENQCIVEPGNPKDCTGVLSCPFAINAANRTIAELTMLEMPEQSTGCYICGVPNCASSAIALCQPAGSGSTSGRCLAFSTVFTEDGGVVVVPQDSGLVLGGDGG